MVKVLKILSLTMIAIFVCFAGHTLKMQKMLSIEGEKLTNYESVIPIYDIAVRYILFILEANDHLEDDHYYIRIQHKGEKIDPPEELYERLSDIDLEFLPGSEYKPVKLKAEGKGYLIVPGPSIDVIMNVRSPEKVMVEIYAYSGPLSGIGVNFTLDWQDGNWIMEESDALIIR